MNRQLKGILSVGIILTMAGLAYFGLSKDKTFFSTSATSNPCEIDFPKATGYVNDYSHLFTEAEKFQLDSIISEFEKQTSNQIAIITIDSIMLGKCDVEQYTQSIGNAWGVGQQKKNNGITIGIAPSLKKIAIRNGYGIEKILTDQETKNIIDSAIIPAFKNAEYFVGIRNGLKDIFKELTKDTSTLH